MVRAPRLNDNAEYSADLINPRGAESMYAATVGRKHAADDFHESGLAAPVGAKQGDGIAGGDGQRNVIEGQAGRLFATRWIGVLQIFDLQRDD